jgi:signal transduction histidine kinase/DNA-binding response OmpR family regulator
MKSTEQVVAKAVADPQAIDYSLLSAAEQAKILNLQQAILESVALGGESMDVINQICNLEEQLLPNAVASVMLLDDADEFLNVYAAPSVPPAGVAQLNGLRPGPGGGSCGNVIYSQEAQFVSNTFCDVRWQDLRQLAHNFNLCACWSVPIYSKARKIIGTFALSSFEHRTPSPFHVKLLDIGSAIIGIVLQRQQAELATQRNEQRYRDHLEHLIAERTVELMAARNEAERLTSVKSSFLANMSHEIRSPLNAVLGICYLLEQRPLDAESRLLLQKMHQSGDSLLGIINDILDFSKIEAGRIEIEQAPFRLTPMLEQLASHMAVVANSKDLELIINPSPVAVDKLIGDGLRLQQVLINLLSNAIKFTAQGEVVFSITIERELDQLIVLRFSVRDTGIGISPEQQQDIFSAFSQADTTISRRFGGSGLGLCISQQLVKLMGGDLQVSSQMGVGSEFWFALPFQYDANVERIPAHLASLELLIADDSVSCGEALSNTARSLGWGADVVHSGDTALQQLMTGWDAHHPYDVVLLDWKMPGKDGLQTAAGIHETLEMTHAEYKTPPIVIMVTAHAREELLSQPGFEHVDAILSKPVTPSTLYNTIATIINQRDHIEYLPPKAHAAKQRLPNVRILLVDDSEINREVAQGILEAEGATVSVAEDGQAALDWLSAYSDSVDLVLMDIQMPRMDGYVATQQIRQNPAWRSLPIIALTAGAFESVKSAALAAGMQDFISKPFNVELLLATIERFTQHRVSINPPLQAKTTDSEPVPALETVNVIANNPVWSGINVEKGLQHLNNPALYQKLLLKFAGTYRNAGQEIAECLRLANTEAAATISHKLKGVAATLALVDVDVCVQEFERGLKAGMPTIEMAESLQQAIDTACAAIAHWTTDVDQAQPLIKPEVNPEELCKLLAQFLAALDLDDPDKAEPILAQLQGCISDSAFKLVSAQLAEFDFRRAEETTQNLIQQLNFK